MKNPLQRSFIAVCFTLVFASCQKRSEVADARPNIGGIEKPSAGPAEESGPQAEEVAKTSDDPADQYFKAWLLVRESEKSANQGESVRMLREALGHFAEIKSKSPEWKTAMVESRIQVTKDALAALSKIDR